MCQMSRCSCQDLGNTTQIIKIMDLHIQLKAETSLNMTMEFQALVTMINLSRALDSSSQHMTSVEAQRDRDHLTRMRILDLVSMIIGIMIQARIQLLSTQFQREIRKTPRMILQALATIRFQLSLQTLMVILVSLVMKSLDGYERI